MFIQDCNNVLSSPYVTRFDLPGSLTEEAFLEKLTQAGLLIKKPEWEEMKRMFRDFQARIAPQLMP
jgi:hypothetical protein